MKRRLGLGLAAVGVALVSCLAGIGIGTSTTGTERIVEKTVEVPVEVEVVKVVTQVVEVPVEVVKVVKVPEVVERIVTVEVERVVTAEAEQAVDQTEAGQHPLVEEFGCQWIMDTYRPMTMLGRDLAVQHLANSMSLKRQERGSFSLVGTGDAAPALRECEAQGYE